MQLMYVAWEEEEEDVERDGSATMPLEEEAVGLVEVVEEAGLLVVWMTLHVDNY